MTRALRPRRIELPADRDTVVAFRRDSFVVSFGNDQRFGGEDRYLAWLRERLAQFPEGQVLFESPLSEPVAQLEMGIRAFDDIGDAGYVNLFYVAPEHRRRGVGRLLHAHAVDIARRHGCSRYRLKVSRSNEAARAFYAALGMTVVSDDGPDLLVLEFARPPDPRRA